MNCWISEEGTLYLLPRQTVQVSEIQRVVQEFLWTQDKLSLKFCAHPMKTRQARQHQEDLGQGVLFVEIDKLLELAQPSPVTIQDLVVAYQKWENTHLGKELTSAEMASEWDIYEALCMLVGAGFGYWDFYAGT